MEVFALEQRSNTMDGFTTDELDELEKEVLRLAKKYPNETKSFYKSKVIN